MQGQILTQTARLALLGLAIGLPAAWLAASRRACHDCRRAGRLCACEAGISYRSCAGAAFGI